MEPIKLPGLAAVVLPKAMREKKVLGSAPGSCIGPQCAHGGLHFKMQPLAWSSAPKVAMPAPGQMPTAPVQPTTAVGMPSLKWTNGPTGEWHNNDGVFEKRESMEEEGEEKKNDKIIQKLNYQAQQPVIDMGNTAPEVARKPLEAATRTKQEAVANLAKKLTR